jgi:hypothetical protein
LRFQVWPESDEAVAGQLVECGDLAVQHGMGVGYAVQVLQGEFGLGRVWVSAAVA